MLGTVFISAAFAFLITVHAASVELARDGSEDSDATTTLSPPQSEVPEPVPIPMERSDTPPGPNNPCAAGPCPNKTEEVPMPMP
uniref:Putative secreted mucin n=1 Tax=Amblyomma cajennense TaxID=34607 RepID=A0A023FD55_AMBCJ